MIPQIIDRDDKELNELAELLLRHRNGGTNVYPGLFREQSEHVKNFYYSIAEQIILAGFTNKGTRNEC